MTLMERFKAAWKSFRALPDQPLIEARAVITYQQTVITKLIQELGNLKQDYRELDQHYRADCQNEEGWTWTPPIEPPPRPRTWNTWKLRLMGQGLTPSAAEERMRVTLDTVAVLLPDRSKIQQENAWERFLTIGDYHTSYYQTEPPPPEEGAPVETEFFERGQ